MCNDNDVILVYGRLIEKNEKSLKMDGCWRLEVERVVFWESGIMVMWRWVFDGGMDWMFLIWVKRLNC